VLKKILPFLKKTDSQFRINKLPIFKKKQTNKHPFSDTKLPYLNKPSPILKNKLPFSNTQTPILKSKFPFLKTKLGS